jgi:REP element-mobilizing transposase RayT
VPQAAEAPQSTEAAETPIDLQALLGDIPTPDPERGTRVRGTQVTPGWSTEPDGATGGETQPSKSAPAAQVPAVADVKTEPPQNGAMIYPFPEEPPLTIEDTRPSVITTLTRLDQLEAASPALAQLKYTCVILPRVPQHYLTGELADRLAEWVPQTCLAYGWRLEALAIRPDYLQWSVQVAPLISPGNLVRTLRQRISDQVFAAFPVLAELNPSGDFWAPGYLIVSGGQAPSAQLLRDYIAQTRRRQGATGSGQANGRG